MQLDAERQRRETIRKAIVAQSLGSARAVAQGVGQGSSVIGGAYGQNWGQAGRDVNFTNQSESIGMSLFQANADLARAQGSAAAANAAGQFSTVLLNKAQDIYRIGQSLFGGSDVPAQSNPWITTVNREP
jgi:hypothetical protein